MTYVEQMAALLGDAPTKPPPEATTGDLRAALTATASAVGANLMLHKCILIAAQADRDVYALRTVGGKLANVAYNLAQRGGQPLSTHDAMLLDTLRREWDAARKVTP